MKKLIIGIDPGNTGAIAYKDDFGCYGVYEMPIMAMGKKGKKNQLNPTEVMQILRKILLDHKEHLLVQCEVIVYLEQVHSMPVSSAASMFNFGMGYGILQGVLSAMGLSYKFVPPQTWKKHFGLLRTDKDLARTLAIQQFPNINFSRKKDIGKADAMLITEYGYQQEK